jgi:Double-GTPase 2
MLHAQLGALREFINFGDRGEGGCPMPRLGEGKTPGVARDAAGGLLHEHLPPLEYVDGEPQFRLFVAGAKNSGKSVFLASLYNQLAAAGNGSCFYARLTSDCDARRLKEKFEMIRDSRENWPPGDASKTEYVFRCFYISARQKQKYPLFSFHYADFPGGDLTNPSRDQAIDVQAAIQNAHTVVFLLDGSKILDALNGAPIDGFTINDDLDCISELATDCIFRPMQFVVTKWDILRPRSLDEIRSFLLSHEKFSAVIEQRRRSGEPTYLIPVSAVGDDFAQYDAVSHAMVKRPYAVPRPYHLDITLALAVTDTILQLFRDSTDNDDPHWLRLLKTLSGPGPTTSWLAKTRIAEVIPSSLRASLSSNEFWLDCLRAAAKSGPAISWLAKTCPRLLLDPLTATAATIILRSTRLSDGIPALAAHLKEDVEERLAKISDRESALNKITEIQHLRVSDFLSRFPAADLLARVEDER